MGRNSPRSAFLRREARKERLEQSLDSIVQTIRGLPGVRKILLFGSLATGRIRSWSDIDLVVIRETDKRFLDRLDEVYRSLPPGPATDVLVYTPEEFAKLQSSNGFFRRIAREGKVLYEA